MRVAASCQKNRLDGLVLDCCRRRRRNHRNHQRRRVSMSCPPVRRLPLSASAGRLRELVRRGLEGQG